MPVTASEFSWSCLIDVTGVTHYTWKHLMPQGRWQRLCLDDGPDIYTQPVELPPTTNVTCLWCVTIAMKHGVP